MVGETVQTPSSRAKAKPIGEPQFALPKFLGKFDFPSEFRDLAEKNTLQVKENYDKFKNATEDVTGGFKDAYETAAKGTREDGVQLIKAARTNIFRFRLRPPLGEIAVRGARVVDGPAAQAV